MVFAATKVGMSVAPIEVHWIDRDTMLRGNGSEYKSVKVTSYIDPDQEDCVKWRVSKRNL
jgi:hypothetical protein